jgi:hypothetical protein
MCNKSQNEVIITGGTVAVDDDYNGHETPLMKLLKMANSLI